MAIPKECKMPDLSHLAKKKLVPSYIISSLTGSDKSLDKKFILYRKRFVQLVDKAIDDYLLVRETVIKQISAESGTIYLFSTINYLENCINSIRRLFYLFDGIKSNKQNPFSIDRTFRRFISRYSSQIRKTRDLTEHIDKYIKNGAKNGAIREGQTIAFKFNKDATKVSIVNCELSLIDLAKLITKFHEFGSELAKYNAKGVNLKSFKIICSKKRKTT